MIRPCEKRIVLIPDKVEIYCIKSNGHEGECIGAKYLVDKYKAIAVSQSNHLGANVNGNQCKLARSENS